MDKLQVDCQKIDVSIGKLNNAAKTQAEKASNQQSFRGDFTFTKAFGELDTLANQCHMLWYNAAGYEVALLDKIRKGMETTDKILSGLIGKGHE